MECGELCPYTNIHTIECNGTNIPTLSPEHMASLTLLSVINEDRGIYMAMIQNHEVKAIVGKWDANMICNFINLGVNILGYWYCGDDYDESKNSVIIVDVNSTIPDFMSPIDILTSTLKPEPCPFNTVSIACFNGTTMGGDSPISMNYDEITKISILMDKVTTPEGTQDIVYEGMYNGVHIDIKHYQIHGLTEEHHEAIEQHNLTSGDIRYLDLNTKIDNFKSEICLHHKAWNNGLTSRIYAYWGCQSHISTQVYAIMITEHLQGNTLAKYLNEDDVGIFGIYNKIIQNILFETLIVKIAHNKLTCDNVLITPLGFTRGLGGKIQQTYNPKFINYSSATICPSDEAILQAFRDDIDLYESDTFDTTDENDASLTHTIFQDLVSINTDIITVIESQNPSPSSYKGQLASVLRHSMTYDVDMWIEMYRDIIMETGVVPTVKNVYNIVYGKLRQELPKWYP